MPKRTPVTLKHTPSAVHRSARRFPTSDGRQPLSTKRHRSEPQSLHRCPERARPVAPPRSKRLRDGASESRERCFAVGDTLRCPLAADRAGEWGRGDCCLGRMLSLPRVAAIRSAAAFVREPVELAVLRLSGRARGVSADDLVRHDVVPSRGGLLSRRIRAGRVRGW